MKSLSLLSWFKRSVTVEPKMPTCPTRWRWQARSMASRSSIATASMGRVCHRRPRQGHRVSDSCRGALRSTVRSPTVVPALGGSDLWLHESSAACLLCLPFRLAVRRRPGLGGPGARPDVGFEHPGRRCRADVHPTPDGPVRAVWLLLTAGVDRAHRCTRTCPWDSSLRANRCAPRATGTCLHCVSPNHRMSPECPLCAPSHPPRHRDRRHPARAAWIGRHRSRPGWTRSRPRVCGMASGCSHREPARPTIPANHLPSSVEQ